MKRRKTLNGALHNFLATLSSRYSDYDGYWLFGLLMVEVSELKMDLLGPSTIISPSPLVAKTIRIAVQKFREQMEKANLELSWIKEARLNIEKMPETQHGIVNGHRTLGSKVKLTVTGVFDNGITYERNLFIFVAPHDASVETRSISRELYPP